MTQARLFSETHPNNPSWSRRRSTMVMALCYWNGFGKSISRTRQATEIFLKMLHQKIIRWTHWALLLNWIRLKQNLFGSRRALTSWYTLLHSNFTARPQGLYVLTLPLTINWHWYGRFGQNSLDWARDEISTPWENEDKLITADERKLLKDIKWRKRCFICSSIVAIECKIIAIVIISLFWKEMRKIRNIPKVPMPRLQAITWYLDDLKDEIWTRSAGT